MPPLQAVSDPPPAERFRRWQELVPPDAALWPTREDMRRIVSVAAGLAELLKLMPEKVVITDGDDAGELAHLRLCIEAAVHELSRLFNPVRYAPGDAPLALVYRGWSDVARVHHGKLHRALKDVVAHFGFADLYEDRPVTGPYDCSIGRPPTDLIARLAKSARRIGRGLATIELPRPGTAPQEAAGQAGLTRTRPDAGPTPEGTAARGEREQEILTALVLLKAEGPGRRVPRATAAYRADAAAPASSYSKAIASLVGKRLVASRRGPRGGIWLTPAGKAAATALAKPATAATV